MDSKPASSSSSAAASAATREAFGRTDASDCRRLGECVECGEAELWGSDREKSEAEELFKGNGFIGERGALFWTCPHCRHPRLLHKERRKARKAQRKAAPKRAEAAAAVDAEAAFHMLARNGPALEERPDPRF